MREFVYGVLVGAAFIYLYNYFDAPGILSYLNQATENAVQSTHGYSDGSPRKTPRN